MEFCQLWTISSSPLLVLVLDQGQDRVEQKRSIFDEKNGRYISDPVRPNRLLDVTQVSVKNIDEALVDNVSDAGAVELKEVVSEIEVGERKLECVRCEIDGELVGDVGVDCDHTGRHHLTDQLVHGNPRDGVVRLPRVIGMSQFYRLHRLVPLLHDGLLYVGPEPAVQHEQDVKSRGKQLLGLAPQVADTAGHNGQRRLGGEDVFLDDVGKPLRLLLLPHQEREVVVIKIF